MAHIFARNASKSVVQQGIDKNFITFCKLNNITQENNIEIASTTPRGIRGLVATKDIPKDECVAVVPDSAIMSCFDALRSHSFMSAIESHGLKKEEILNHHNDIATEYYCTSIYPHQRLLALFIAHISFLLASTPSSSEVANVEYPNGNDVEDCARKFAPLVLYMPDIGKQDDFSEFRKVTASLLPTEKIYNSVGEALAKHHKVSIEEFNNVLLWAYCMVFSRGISLDHRKIMVNLARDTPVEKDIAEFVASGKKNVDLPASAFYLDSIIPAQRYHVACVVPVVDMINHDAQNPNVFITVDNNNDKRFAVVVRSSRAISKGEEITTRYGGIDDYNVLRHSFKKYNMGAYIAAPLF